VKNLLPDILTLSYRSWCWCFYHLKSLEGCRVNIIIK